MSNHDNQDNDNNHGDRPKPSGFASYIRIFSYVDRSSWALYSTAFIAAIGAGAALPLMNFLQSLLRQDMTFFDLEETGSPSVKVTTNGISERLAVFVQSCPSRPDVKVLNGVDLKIPAGKTTTLVGASGSGKRTIIGLLECWYDPAAGTIQFDGRDIQSINLAWLRTQIRLVQQGPVLFSGTIIDNVVFSLEGTSHANAFYEDKLALVKGSFEEIHG